MTPEELEAIEARAAKLPEAFITACIEDRKAYVKVKLQTLKEMHDWHDFILDAPKNVHALTAEIRRLQAAQQWQPIETAPKDGTKVLAYWVDRQIRSSDQAGTYFNKPMKRWETETTVAQSEYYPTHWMPLQTPPVQS